MSNAKPWTLAAVAATAGTLGLAIITIGFALLTKWASVEVPVPKALRVPIGLLLPNLMFLSLVASGTLWVVAAARRLARR